MTSKHFPFANVSDLQLFWLFDVSDYVNDEQIACCCYLLDCERWVLVIIGLNFYWKSVDSDSAAEELDSDSSPETRTQTRELWTRTRTLEVCRLELRLGCWGVGLGLRTQTRTRTLEVCGLRLLAAEELDLLSYLLDSTTSLGWGSVFCSIWCSNNVVWLIECW